MWDVRDACLGMLVVGRGSGTIADSGTLSVRICFGYCDAT